MDFNIVVQHKFGRPILDGNTGPLIDLTNNPKLTLCLVEGEPTNNDPYILIISADENGTVVLRAGLDEYVLAAHEMMQMAKNYWSWTPPEELNSLTPQNKDALKRIIETMKQELEKLEEE